MDGVSGPGWVANPSDGLFARVTSGPVRYGPVSGRSSVQVVGALGWVALAVGVVGLVRGMPWLGPRPRLTAGILVLVGLLGIGIAQGG